MLNACFQINFKCKLRKKQKKFSFKCTKKIKTKRINVKKIRKDLNYKKKI